MANSSEAGLVTCKAIFDEPVRWIVDRLIRFAKLERMEKIGLDVIDAREITEPAEPDGNVVDADEKATKQ